MPPTHDRLRGPAIPSLPSLTGVRGVAAFAVFVSHMRYVFPAGEGDAGDAGPNLSRLLNWGAYGVTLFFILSGFVLAWTWADSTGPRTYARRRVARVWPVHAVVWAAFVVTALVGAAPRPDAGAAAATLVLVQCWIPGRGWADAVNPVAWTLSCEAFFYLVFPFVVGPIRRLGARGLLLAAGAVAAFGAATVIGLLEPRGIRVSSFPPFRIWEFLLGVIAGTAMRSGYLRRSLPVPVSLMLLVGAMAAGTWERRLRGSCRWIS